MSDLAVLSHPVWQEVAPELAPKDFTRSDGTPMAEKMSASALRRLSRIRRRSGVPFRVVSSYRPPHENPGAEKSAHMELPCTAVDLRVLNNEERYRLLAVAFAEGVERIGCYLPTDHQGRTWGKGSGSVHLDFSTSNPTPRFWMSW